MVESLLVAVDYEIYFWTGSNSAGLRQADQSEDRLAAGRKFSWDQVYITVLTTKDLNGNMNAM